MPKAIVTGGAGFIGSNLADKLIEEGNKVVVVDNLSTGKRDNLNPEAKFYEMDIRDDKVFDVFSKEKPDVVFHYAAQIDVRKSVKDSRKDAEINVVGSLNVLEACRKSEVNKFIFASTGGAMYGDTDKIPTPETHIEKPESPYGAAKSSVEKYLNFYGKNFGLDWKALRYSNVYGPRQDPKGEAGVVAIFMGNLLENKVPAIYGSGDQTRDFLFVEDAVRAALLAAEKEDLKEHPVYNISTGKEIAVNELYEKVNQFFENRVSPEYREERKGEQKRSSLDFSKAKKNLGWEPKLYLNEGLKNTAEWFKKSN